MDKFTYIANAHVTYIDELYAAYKNDPSSIDPSWKEFFDGFDFAITHYGEGLGQSTPSVGTAQPSALSGTIMHVENLPKEIRVRAMIHAYRSRAHLRSKTNPVRERRDRKPLIDPENFGLGAEDMATVFEAGTEIGIGAASLAQIVQALKTIYEGPMGFEFLYIRNAEMLDWFKSKVSSSF